MTTMMEKAALAVRVTARSDDDGYVNDPEDVVRAVLQAIREPSNAMHNAGAFSEHQSRPPKIVVGEEGALSVEWRPANPSGLFTVMIDALLAEPDRPT